ncbi:MAG: chromosome segregation protein SMC [Bacteroidota bacterium]
MQLTKLELFGFKSFANRQTLIFDDGITGIVGPNGCGKSNIVDAIRWVLGEQKTKNLRSEKMENVIFNGTKSKRKSNFAEVSLTFENTKNLLPTEYSNVKITRKLYRSGESDYQINGVSCRLKDIQNLFLDTGISSDSYAIIELGMVDAILTNKDNERRKFFEEAAGISKYKIRKRETLRKLRDTDSDLERVEDILYEIDKSRKALEKQARRTQRYFEIKEQYKHISSQYAFLSMRSIRERQNQLRILEDQLTDEITEVQSGLALYEARIQELKKELVDRERMLATAQEDLNAHVNKLLNLETEKSIKTERLKYLQQREHAIRNQMETEKRRHTENQTKRNLLEEQQIRLEKEQAAQHRIASSAQEKVNVLRRTYQEQQQQVDSLNVQYRETEQDVQRISREIDMKKVKIQSLESELRRAEEDKYRRTADLDAFTDKGEELRSSVESMEKQVAELEMQRDTHQAQLRQVEQDVTTLKDKVYKTNRLIDAKQNEYSLTKSLVENLEGFPASVKFLKKNAKWIKDAPLLSDVFAVPETHKVAIENYLEGYLSYYVVPSRQDALLSVRMLAEASKGRANFFILDELVNYKPHNPLIFTQAQPVMEVIDCAPEYKKLAAFLLDKVYIVRSEEEIPQDVPEEVIFLTQSGNITRRRFMMSGGSLGLFEGKRLGRAKNLEKLDKEISKLQKQLTQEKGDLEKAQKQLEALKRTDYTGGLDKARSGLSEKQRDLSVLQTKEQEYKEFLTRVGQRTDSLSDELEKLQTEIQEATPLHRQREEEVLQFQGQLAQLRETAQENGDLLNEANQFYNQEHIKRIHLDNEYQNVSRELDQLLLTMDQYMEREAQLLEDLTKVEKDTEELISSNLQDDEHIVFLYNQKKEKEERVGRMEAQVGASKNSIRQAEENSSGARKKREDMVTRQQSLKEQETEIKLEIHSLRERMSVEFQVDVMELSKVVLFDKPVDEYDYSTIEEQVHKLRTRVQNYGEINPMAVEAFQEIQERHEFISTQRNDLLEAKDSLLTTISEIDQTAKEKFIETFTVVREHFQSVFKSLFYEEDNCDLILMDPENPLESDINIIARPKGKRPLTIKQLSGGEKTLTAVALLFAIYLIKPAPFCVFDEVDAPLDDANIDKFNNIIRDFSKESQFIIVTHNKRTMSSTSVIYGVTMANQGISSVVPVSLEELALA